MITISSNISISNYEKIITKKNLKKFKYNHNSSIFDLIYTKSEKIN